MSGMFSSKGRYALRVMADLAMHDGWVSLGDIADRQNISRKYLEQVVQLMRKAGFVDSQRGKTGGYKLTREPSEYTLVQIIEAAEGSDGMNACADCVMEGEKEDACPNSCNLAPVWQEIDSLTSSYLSTKTLADVIGEQEEPGEQAARSGQ